jgi:hypothetical protein
MSGLGKQDTIGMPIVELANREWNVGPQEAQQLTVRGRRIWIGDAKNCAVLTFGVAYAENRS